MYTSLWRFARQRNHVELEVTPGFVGDDVARGFVETFCARAQTDVPSPPSSTPGRVRTGLSSCTGVSLRRKAIVSNCFPSARGRQPCSPSAARMGTLASERAHLPPSPSWAQVLPAPNSAKMPPIAQKQLCTPPVAMSLAPGWELRLAVLAAPASRGPGCSPR